MPSNDDTFWKQLRDDVADAERAELAAAERELAQLDDEPLEPLADEQIERMVTSALERADHERAAAPVRHISSGRQLLAAAAALLVAPKFLVAATAVTVLAVTAALLQNTTRSLPFQDAVAIALDDGRDDDARIAAQGRVYFDVVESLETIRAALDDEALAPRAGACMTRVRDALALRGGFALTRFPEAIAALRARVAAAAGLDAGTRAAALDALTDQAVHGIAALLELSRRAGPPALLRHNGVHLHNLRALAFR